MIVEALTKMPFELQSQRLRFFARVDTETRLKILDSQRQLFHRLKNQNPNTDNAALTLASLLISIHKIIDSLDQVDLNVIQLRSKNNKHKLKREKLLGYWSIVKKLKIDQKMSFRDISKYLLKYHKLEVSYTTIHAVWQEIELNKDK